jgi:SAM-dependent methyltransferase
VGSDRLIHEGAAAGFGAGSGAYVRGRPSYPAAAVELLQQELALGPGVTVVDVGAGTGKWTQLLAGTGARVVAVEPVAAMRDELLAAMPAVDTLDGTAESMPLADGAADAVTVAQAFHWFRHDDALAEMARVLRSGGGLALLWNRRDESVPWVARMSEVLKWREFECSGYDRVDWAAVIGRAGRFSQVSHASLPYEQRIDRDGLADRVRSVSYVATMAEDERERLVARVLELVVEFPEQFVLPYNTLIWWCTRV